MQYNDSYDDDRKAFIDIAGALSEKYRNVKLSSVKVPSRIDDNLTIDCCYVPSQNTHHGLVIISSGVHGIEGLLGSAIQRMFMKEILPEHVDLSKNGVLLIHSVNPYGHKYFRRVTENNVDMNRNFDTNQTLFSADNKAYSSLETFLNPKKAYRHTTLNNLSHFIRTIILIRKYGLGVLRQAILQGQYAYPEGIFFGGTNFEPQNEKLEGLLSGTIQDYPIILVVDLHTGYGKRGQLHCFRYDDLDDPEVDQLTNRIFDGYEIEGGNAQKEDTQFFSVTGSFIEYISRLASDKQRCIPMAFEFGTMDSHQPRGQIKSLQIMIAENQGFHHGYCSNEHEEILKKLFREMFFPSDTSWRNQVIMQSEEALSIALKRFQQVSI